MRISDVFFLCRTDAVEGFLKKHLLVARYLSLILAHFLANFNQSTSTPRVFTLSFSSKHAFLMQTICGRTIGYNIILLLLQIILERQQDIAKNKDGKNDITEFLTDPVIDDFVLNEFKSHKMFEVYKLNGTLQGVSFDTPKKKNQNHLKLTLRDLRTIVATLYKTPISTPVNENLTKNRPTLITLCDRYYALRIEQLSTDMLPKLREELKAAKVF